MTSGSWPGALLVGLLALAVLLRGGVTPAAASALQLAAAALALALAAMRSLPAAPRDALAFAVAWSGLALASIAWSATPDASLDGAGYVVAAALVFLFGVSLVERRVRERFALHLAALGAMVGSLAIAMTLPGERTTWPFGNPNHLAGWLLLPGGIAVVSVLRGGMPRRGGRESALLWFGLLVLVAAGLAASRSRGAALGAAAGLASFVALARLGPRRGLAVAFAGWAAAALALTLGPAWSPDGMPLYVDGSESSVGMRWALYAAVTRAIGEHGPLGVGIGAFGAGFQAHRPGALLYRVDYAHSEPLHGALELGLPFLVLLLVTLAAALHRLRAHDSSGGSLTTWGALVALFAVAAHALVDFPLHVPAIALGFAALAGALWRATVRGAAGHSVLATRATLAALGTTLLLLAGTRTVALEADGRSQRCVAGGDWGAPSAAARRGLWLRPGRASLWSRVADAAEEAEHVGAGGPDAGRRALGARKRAVRASPLDARLHVALARTRAKQGERIAALSGLETARRMEPQSAVVELARARMWLDAGRPREAARAVRAAAEHHDRVSGPAFDALLRATDDPDLLGDAVPRDIRSLRQAARILQWHGYPREAADSLSRAVDLAPDDVDLLLDATRALLRIGASERAASMLRRGLHRRPNDPRLVEALAGLDAPGPVGAGRNGDAS